MSDNHDPVVTEGATPEAGEETAGGCPVVHGRTHPARGDANQEWWPNKLNLKILAKNPAVANPLGEEFDYAVAFSALDLAAVKRDIAAVRDRAAFRARPRGLLRDLRGLPIGDDRVVVLSHKNPSVLVGACYSGMNFLLGWRP